MIYKIKRAWYGWVNRKHGIFLPSLPENKQNLLINNSFFKWIEPDVQSYQIIFRIHDMNLHEKIQNRIIYNHNTESFDKYRNLEKNLDLVDWNCAICKDPIKIYATYKKQYYNAYLCPTCRPTHGTTKSRKRVDMRIVESANKFSTEYKKYLKNQQRQLLRYLEKNSKI